MIPVQVVGLGMSPDDLTPKALKIIQEAQVLVGGKRLLGYFPDHPGEKIVLGKNPAAALRQLAPMAASRRVALLASGDPNFYGIGPLAVQVFGADNVQFHPNITAAQAACARLKLDWHDATLISLHGRSWEALAAALTQVAKLIIYTDPEHTPGAIASFLAQRGYGEARLCILEDLGQPSERLTWLTAGEAQGQDFAPLNTVVALLPEAPPGQLHLGMPEAAFSHEAGLITKAEIRAVALAKLQLQPGQIMWDLGAGCGSVGLEAGLLLPGGQVVAVEQNAGRVAQILANRDKFKAGRLQVIHGQAPECLAGLPDPQRVFIGGGGPRLADILAAALARLDANGRVVISAARLETLETARHALAQAGWQVEVVQLQVSRSRPLGGDYYLQALNPVWLITGWPEMT